MRKYNVAMYMRLSREDGDDRESYSIENQRDIIEKYISDHEELEKYDEYIDDGYTGTNFNRPDFKRMMQSMEEGKIDCIITKDLSRFGRDHIETGYYLERYMPLKNIRYIAINDDVDTNNPDGLQFLTFKLSFNDYYAQDISNKIKSVKQRKIEKGEYQGGTAPYGYKKDDVIKNHLVIDDYAASIVKRIFNMYVYENLSTLKIANKLNEEKIESPAIYLKIATFVNKPSKNSNGYSWCDSQIGKILKNQVYLGHVVGGKYRKISHKIDKKVSMKREEYVIVENMHEAIIDKETFEKAQIKLSKWDFSKESKKNKHPLKNIVYCAECGHKAVYRVREREKKDKSMWKQEKFICGNRNKGKNHNCNCRSIKADELTQIVNDKLKSEIAKLQFSKNEIVSLYQMAQKNIEATIQYIREKIKKLSLNLSKKEKMIETMYSDKLNGIITCEEFERFYTKINAEKNEIQKDIKEEYEKIKDIEKGRNKIDFDKIIKLGEQLLNMNNPTRELYEELIDRINFDSNGNVEILFKFENEYTQNSENLKEVS